jgi:hypothetical protein
MVGVHAHAHDLTFETAAQTRRDRERAVRGNGPQIAYYACQRRGIAPIHLVRQGVLRMKMLIGALALMVVTVTSQSAAAADTGATLNGSSSTVQSDLWWNPDESGWGMQVVQQADILFVTLFVYNATGQPTFYTGALNISGSLTWSGDLYATNGPWFGGAFNPAAVTYRRVGALTFAAPLINSGTVSYSVDGVQVAKAIERQLIRRDDYSGQYVYLGSGVITGCANPAYNGSPTPVAQSMHVSHNGTSMAATFAGPAATCVYGGSYDQRGRMGRWDGTFSCTHGLAGTFSYFEMSVHSQGISGRFQSSVTSGFAQRCQSDGKFTAIRSD